jgi:hypothetical protein
MADPTPASESGAGHDSQSPPGAPRWVKVFAAIALTVVVVIAIMLLVGGADHGLGRHSSGGAGGNSASSSTTQADDGAGHRIPPGAHGP